MSNRQTPTMTSWDNMMGRCYRVTTKNYKYYGGRGIKVCKRWHKYQNFLADMGERPNATTLDRIDPNKGYNPKNCRWATIHQQSFNTRDRQRSNGLPRGIYFNTKNKFKKYRAKISTIELGSFYTLEEAIEARQKAVEKYVTR